MSAPFKIGGIKHQNYCLKRKRYSMYCNGSECVLNQNTPETKGGIKNDEGVEIKPDIIKNLNTNQKLILKHVAEKGEISLNELTQKLNTSKTTLYKELSQLKEKQLINDINSYKGKRIDLKIDKDLILEEVKDTKEALGKSFSKASGAIFNSIGPEGLPVSTRKLKDIINNKSTRAIELAKKELKEKGLIKIKDGKIFNNKD